MRPGARSLYDAAASTFESMALLFASGDLAPDQREQPITAGVRVAFRGPGVDGHLELRISAALVPAIASNMLGENDAPSERVQRDALGEIANVICGNALPAVLDSPEVFELDAPCPLDGNAPHAAPVAAADLWLETGRAQVLLFVDRTA